MIPIGRETILARFPWVTFALVILNSVFFAATWPAENAFLSVRFPDSPLVSEGKALASIALDGGTSLPSDLRVQLEDLRARPDFPDEAADRLLQSIQKTFDYLPTLKRPDWNLRYAAYQQAREQVVDKKIPWHSLLDKYVFRFGDPFWPRLATHFWVHTGYLHVLATLFFLWLAGAQMEEGWGSFFTFLIYATGGAAGALAVNYAFPGGSWVLVGGGAATAALLGAFLARHFTAPVRFFYVVGVSYGVFRLPAWIFLAAWVYVVSRAGWLTDGRLQGAAAQCYYGTGFAWGVLLGWLLGLGGRDEDDGTDDNPVILNQRAAKAAQLLQKGRVQEAQDAYRAILETQPAHLVALQGLLAACESLQQEEEAAHVAVKMIRSSMAAGRGQLAEEVFRRWSLKLFQTKLPAQDRLSLAQDLESLQLWREALAYYRSVSDGARGTTFAGKALFASAKIFKEQMKKPDDAAPFLRQLLDPPYDLEWRALAEAELRAIGKL